MKKLFFIGFLCSVFAVHAQDTLLLSYNDLVQMMPSQNLEIQSNELKFKLAKASFYKSVGKALPTLGMGIKRYELSGYTQSTTGEFVEVEKNNELNGKSFRLSWNLRELLFNSVADKPVSESGKFVVCAAVIKGKIKIIIRVYNFFIRFVLKVKQLINYPIINIGFYIKPT